MIKLFFRNCFYSHLIFFQGCNEPPGLIPAVTEPAVNVGFTVLKVSFDPASDTGWINIKID